MKDFSITLAGFTPRDRCCNEDDELEPGWRIAGLTLPNDAGGGVEATGEVTQGALRETLLIGIGLDSQHWPLEAVVGWL